MNQMANMALSLQTTNWSDVPLATWMHLAALILAPALFILQGNGKAKRALTSLTLLLLASLAALVPGIDALSDDVLILHEGNMQRMIAALFGDAHTGAGFREFWLSVAGDNPVPILVLQRMNRAASVLALGIILYWARIFLQSGLPTIFLLAVLAFWCPALVLPISSDIPSSMLNLYFALAILPYYTLVNTEPGRLIQGGSILLLGILGYLIAAARLELLLLVVPGLSIAALMVTGQQRLLRWAEAQLRRVALYFFEKPLAFVAAFMVLLAGEALFGNFAPGYSHWAARGANPLGPSFLRVPSVVGEWISPGFSVLLCLGWYHALKQWRTFGALSISLLFLLRLYMAASHYGTWTNAAHQGMDWELFRYLTHLGTPLFLLVILGVHQIELLSRSWVGGKRGYHFALSLLAIACFTEGWNARTAWAALYDDPFTEQREGRFVVAQILANPDCAFIAPYHREGTTKGEGVSSSHALLFESGKARVLETTFAEARQATADRECLLVYHGMDCHLDGFDCPPPEGELRASDRFVARRFSHEKEYGFLDHRVELKLFRVK